MSIMSIDRRTVPARELEEAQDEIARLNQENDSLQADLDWARERIQELEDHHD